MIEQSATVVACHAGIAWVETVRRSACANCAEGESCGSGALARLFAPRANRLAVEDRMDLRVGERVIVGIPDAVLVRASAIAYLLPLAGLIGAAGLAEWLGLGDLPVALIGIGGLGAGLWVTGFLTGGSAARARYRPVVLRRDGAALAVAFDPIPGTRARP